MWATLPVTWARSLNIVMHFIPASVWGGAHWGYVRSVTQIRLSRAFWKEGKDKGSGGAEVPERREGEAGR
jgi:hypothetical protein